MPTVALRPLPTTQSPVAALCRHQSPESASYQTVDCWQPSFPGCRPTDLEQLAGRRDVSRFTVTCSENLFSLLLSNLYMYLFCSGMVNKLVSLSVTAEVGYSIACNVCGAFDAAFTELLLLLLLLWLSYRSIFRRYAIPKMWIGV